MGNVHLGKIPWNKCYWETAFGKIRPQTQEPVQLAEVEALEPLTSLLPLDFKSPSAVLSTLYALYTS